MVINYKPASDADSGKVVRSPSTGFVSNKPESPRDGWEGGNLPPTTPPLN